MMTPTLHLNGTSKQALTEALDAAARVLHTALGLLNETAPNGRDYYPQGPHALTQAMEEHVSRLERVQTVRAELMAMWEQIEDATKGAR
jgi:hypothetical protein